MTEIGLFSTNLSNTAPSIGGLLQDKIEESPSYTISSHLYTIGAGLYRSPRRVHLHGGAFGRLRGALSTRPGDRGQPAQRAPLPPGTAVARRPQECRGDCS